MHRRSNLERSKAIALAICISDEDLIMAVHLRRRLKHGPLDPCSEEGAMPPPNQDEKARQIEKDLLAYLETEHIAAASETSQPELPALPPAFHPPTPTPKRTVLRTPTLSPTFTLRGTLAAAFPSSSAHIPAPTPTPAYTLIPASHASGNITAPAHMEETYFVDDAMIYQYVEGRQTGKIAATPPPSPGRKRAQKALQESPEIDLK